MNTNLSSVQKAAILLLSLDDEVSAEVMKQLDEKEVKLLTGTVGRLGMVGGETVNRIQDEFMKELMTHRGLDGPPKEKIRSILSKFLPETKIDQHMEAMLLGYDVAEGMDRIQDIDGKTLATMIGEEHPQTIALILAHLDDTKSAEVLTLLPDENRSDIVMRIANIEQVSPQAMRMIQSVLSDEVSSTDVARAKPVGGGAAVASMMNNLDGKTIQAIFDEIEEDNPAFCEDIRSLMYVFGDLAELSNTALQSVLKEVTNELITLALKTAPEGLRGKFFGCMSSRAAEMIKEELEVMGPTRLSEVEAAQTEMVGIARRLEEEGKISLGSKGGSDEFV